MILVRRRAGGMLPGPPAAPTAAPAGRNAGLGDRVLEGVAGVAGVLPTAVLLFIVAVMVVSAIPAIRFGGAGFFGDVFSIGNQYLAPITRNGVQASHGAEFGALPEMLGTLVTSVIALGLAVPISVGGVLMLSEWIPGRAQGVLSLILELLAGVPSVVFGLWGVAVLGPFFAAHVYPAASAVIGGFPWLFPWVPSPASWLLAGIALLLWAGVAARIRGPGRRGLLFIAGVVSALTLAGAIAPWFAGFVAVGSSGSGMLTAALVLAIMIIPIVASTTRELVRRVPVLAREGALALGMDRHETAKVVTIPYVRTGVLACALLGWGRAIGETIAVFLIIGNIFVGFPPNIYSSGGTLASTIAATLDGTLTDTTGTSTSALAEMGLMLLVISLVTTLGGRLLIRRVSDEALPVGRGV